MKLPRNKLNVFLATERKSRRTRNNFKWTHVYPWWAHTLTVRPEREYPVGVSICQWYANTHAPLLRLRRHLKSREWTTGHYDRYGTATCNIHKLYETRYSGSAIPNPIQAAIWFECQCMASIRRVRDSNDERLIRWSQAGPRSTDSRHTNAHIDAFSNDSRSHIQRRPAPVARFSSLHYIPFHPILPLRCIIVFAECGRERWTCTCDCASMWSWVPRVLLFSSKSCVDRVAYKNIFFWLVGEVLNVVELRERGSIPEHYSFPSFIIS